jgi:hypothetical protein
MISTAIEPLSNNIREKNSIQDMMNKKIFFVDLNS